MKKGVWSMKKGLLLFLAMLLLSCTFTVYAADLPINDASKWTPSFTGEREYKTPDQSVKAISNGVEFTGIGGERENFTYVFTQPLNFPKEDLTIEFTLKEGFEEEMLFAFALMDKPNWGCLTWLWIVLAVVVVVGGGAAVYFLVIKKKKVASTDANENK